MPTLNGSLITGLVGEPLLGSSKGRFVTIAAFRSELGATINRRFKCQCTNPHAPQGIVTWTNDNGTILNRPVYPEPYGPVEIVESWITQE